MVAKKTASKKKPATKKPTARKRSGPPTKYNPLYHPDMVYRLALKGFTDEQIAKNIGICRKTLSLWRGKYPKLDAMMAMGKVLPNELVERSLFQRAIGYSYYKETPYSYLGKTKIIKTIEHVPPDTKAAFIWLVNRAPERWRYKLDVDITQPITLILPNDPRAKKLVKKDKHGDS